MALRAKREGALMITRLANQSDFPAILEVMRDTDSDKTAYLKAQIAHANVVVAEEAGTVIGLIVWNREFFSLPFIWLVGVSPAHRRNGIAGRLFAFVERECIGTRLYTSTNESHNVMHRLLERRGYRRAGLVDVDPLDAEVFYRIDLA